MTSNAAHGIGFCDQHKIMETTKCCISQFAKIVHVNQLFYCNKCVTGTLPCLRLYRNHRMFITTFADYVSGVLIQLRLVENWLKIERSQDQIPWGTLLFSRKKKSKQKKNIFFCYKCIILVKILTAISKCSISILVHTFVIIPNIVCIR